MKPATFVEYIFQNQQNILKGWHSQASFEGYVQVILDSIVREHLMQRVALFENPDDNSLVMGQQMGKSAISDDFVQPSQQIPYQDWQRMREIKYTEGTKISDLFIKNERFVRINSADDGIVFQTKGTHYWIELKVESPGTESYKDFGGQSPKEAYEDDIEKLKQQKNVDQGTGMNGIAIAKRRYWFIMMAFSDTRRGWLKSRPWATWTISREEQSHFGSMRVCLREL